MGEQLLVEVAVLLGMQHVRTKATKTSGNFMLSFRMDTKVTHLLLILVMIAAGAGLLAKAYLARNAEQNAKSRDPDKLNDE